MVAGGRGFEPRLTESESCRPFSQVIVPTSFSLSTPLSLCRFLCGPPSTRRRLRSQGSVPRFRHQHGRMAEQDRDLLQAPAISLEPATPGGPAQIMPAQVLDPGAAHGRLETLVHLHVAVAGVGIDQNER